jgi:hypothetical protein
LKIALITDAWTPQVNGVVTTLLELVAGLQQRGHEVEIIETSGVGLPAFPVPGLPRDRAGLAPGP